MVTLNLLYANKVLRKFRCISSSLVSYIPLCSYTMYIQKHGNKPESIEKVTNDTDNLFIKYSK